MLSIPQYNFPQVRLYGLRSSQRPPASVGVKEKFYMNYYTCSSFESEFGLQTRIFIS